MINLTSSVKWQVHRIFVCLLFSVEVSAQIRYSIPEEMMKGSFVGNIAQDLGIDAKIIKSARARIVNGDSGRFFELNTDKGILIVKERIDREEMCGQTTQCSFSFEIILENPMQLHSVTVEILDINDNAPSFPRKKIKLDIIESALPGSRFLLDRAVDPDIGLNSLQSYYLKPTENFDLKMHSRPDGSKYVDMVLRTPLDREKQDEMSLLLTAVDGGDPKRSGTVIININILDANDNYPIFSQSVYKAAVAENALKDTVVTTVSATDADKGLNGQVTYVYTQIADSVADLFNLNEKTGEIRLTGHLDYEKEKHYELDIQAKDQGGYTDSTKVVIEIIDVNDNFPLITLTSFTSLISEDSLAGTTVAIINVKDLDSGQYGKVNCKINQNIPFTIKASLKNYYTLLTDGPLDRETLSEYNITVTASDEGSPPLTSKKTLVLNVADVNDNPPKFSETIYTAYVAENNSPGVSIVTVHAEDADCNQNAHITYVLEEGRVDGATLTSFLSINSETGVIYALRHFDYEQIRDCQVVVKAQDGGSPPLSSVVTVNIFIQDQNDNIPQILYPVYSESSLVAEMVPRSADVGYLVTKVVAVDADSGQNAWLSYKLLKATDRTLFEVGLQNGEIRTLRQVTDKDAVKQRLVVVVEDNGQPSRSATVNVNVAVADSFPEVLSEFGDFSQDKDYSDNLTFCLVVSLAIVSFLFISCIIVILSAKFYRWRQSRLFYESKGNLPVIPSAYYPPRYADAGATGTLQHVYNYEVCLTTDSGKSEYRYIRPVSQTLVNVEVSDSETIPHVQRENCVKEDADGTAEVRINAFSRDFIS